MEKRKSTSTTTLKQNIEQLQKEELEREKRISDLRDILNNKRTILHDLKQKLNDNIKLFGGMFLLFDDEQDNLSSSSNTFSYSDSDSESNSELFIYPVDQEIIDENNWEEMSPVLSQNKGKFPKKKKKQEKRKRRKQKSESFLQKPSKTKTNTKKSKKKERSNSQTATSETNPKNRSRKKERVNDKHNGLFQSQIQGNNDWIQIKPKKYRSKSVVHRKRLIKSQTIETSDKKRVQSDFQKYLNGNKKGKKEKRKKTKKNKHKSSRRNQSKLNKNLGSNELESTGKSKRKTHEKNMKGNGGNDGDDEEGGDKVDEIPPPLPPRTFLKKNQGVEKVNKKDSNTPVKKRRSTFYTPQLQRKERKTGKVPRQGSDNFQIYLETKRNPIKEVTSLQIFKFIDQDEQKKKNKKNDNNSIFKSKFKKRKIFQKISRSNKNKNSNKKPKTTATTTTTTTTTQNQQNDLNKSPRNTNIYRKKQIRRLKMRREKLRDGNNAMPSPRMSARRKQMMENKKKFRQSIGLHNKLPRQIEIDLQNIFKPNTGNSNKTQPNRNNSDNSGNNSNNGNGNGNNQMNGCKEFGWGNSPKNKELSRIFIPDFTSVQENNTSPNNNSTSNSGSMEFDESGLPTFDTILNNYLSNFVQFSASEYNDENILFWSRVNKFKEYIRLGRKEDARVVAQEILNQHILEDSDKEINISWKLRTELISQLKDVQKFCPSDKVFDRAHKSVYDIMSGDLYLSFFRTPFYQEIIHEIEKHKKI
ncbi:double hit isoform b [Anaeramoeba flamelloides]|uniref:Double hit isoform b n=1 Tax=Anaeramoeba flamelloides TaxID=1746091 RepID=A0AAV8ABR7_9EUKA|nr:double hit isoform b [Anaeramoeba flamelloides]